MKRQSASGRPAAGPGGGAATAGGASAFETWPREAPAAAGQGPGLGAWPHAGPSGTSQPQWGCAPGGSLGPAPGGPGPGGSFHAGAWPGQAGRGASPAGWGGDGSGGSSGAPGGNIWPGGGGSASAYAGGGAAGAFGAPAANGGSWAGGGGGLGGGLGSESREYGSGFDDAAPRMPDPTLRQAAPGVREAPVDGCVVDGRAGLYLSPSWCTLQAHVMSQAVAGHLSWHVRNRCANTVKYNG